jgi:hypothetical protein
MMPSLRLQRCLLLVIAAVATAPTVTFAEMQTPARTSPVARDGSHDFDFEIGTWKSHLRRRVHPLSASSTWVEYDGTTIVRKVWNGAANLVELEVAGPAGHIDALSLRLYDPASHQWSLNFANRAVGQISPPPMIGEFRDGRGEFFDREIFDGRQIRVRFVISDITASTCRFEQAYSDDDGKTWESNWIATDTRVSGHEDHPPEKRMSRLRSEAAASKGPSPKQRDAK